jgi:hypothetical protein
MRQRRAGRRRESCRTYRCRPSRRPCWVGRRWGRSPWAWGRHPGGLLATYSILLIQSWVYGSVFLLRDCFCWWVVAVTGCLAGAFGSGKRVRQPDLRGRSRGSVMEHCTFRFNCPTNKPSRISRASSLCPTSSKASVASWPPTSRRTSSPPLEIKLASAVPLNPHKPSKTKKKNSAAMQWLVGSKLPGSFGKGRCVACRDGGFEERNDTYGCSSTKLDELYTLS